MIRLINFNLDFLELELRNEDEIVVFLRWTLGY
jgi:hypothetical protein